MLIKMRSNPFSTRFIQPGALPYEFFGHTNSRVLIQRLLSLRSKRGMIVGPHGSGKSTLIKSLINEISLVEPGKQVFVLQFSSDKLATQLALSGMRVWTNRSLVILDGYEQLPFWTRMLVSRTVRRKSITLLATMHQPRRGFEILWQTVVDNTSAEWVIAQLLVGSGCEKNIPKLLQSTDWSMSRMRNGQNLRESLFDMYDWWQKNESRT